MRRNKVDSPPEMGVFKWLRRERVTVSVSADAIPPQEHPQPTTQVGTIRTEEYKRDLAEFQARRSTGAKDCPELPDTPTKKCGRNSLPCTNCTTTNDKTFEYEKKSAQKYKKKTHKRAKSAAADERIYDVLPNIQFLFQNQVFMPGNVYPTYSEPHRRRHKAHRSPDFPNQKHIDFNEDQSSSPTPLFYKNNSLPFDVKHFLEASRSDHEEVDGKDRVSSHCSMEEGGDAGKTDNTDDKLWEVMSELKHFDQWADEQLNGQNSSKSDDSQSDTSAYGLPIASASDLDVAADRNRTWNQGTWGVVPVQVKRLQGVSMEMVRRKNNTEINILRKYRHPNIILLMGLYADVQNNIHIICEQCIDSLYGILHIQGRILSAQTAVRYALDVANALVFLRMQGYIHTELTSQSIMITSHDAAKLADLGPCVKLQKEKPRSPKEYDLYSPEPQYVNIEDTRQSTTTESEPLISKHASETYLALNSVAKEYTLYRESDLYRWHAPELFEPDEMGMVYPCVKSDVYSLCLILWESCNAAVPWKTLTYEKLKELYTLWKTGIRLPQDGTYPGGLLALLQAGLCLPRSDRLDLTALHRTLHSVKCKIEDLEYLIIPARLSKKKSTFSSVAWDTNSPTDESDCLSPITQNMQHKAVVHKNKDSSTDTSEKESKSDASPLYETILKDKYTPKLNGSKTCYISDEEGEEERPMLKYQHLQEQQISSACSTPIAKIRARIKDIGTPGALHRSDSTEYCSILSPDNRHFALNDDSNKDQSVERPTAKLSRSFTPQSYKPLHIKVPDFNLDCVKSILKEQSGCERSSYNFDIKNYSLPSTPIARSNKLRKNAWLSGDLDTTERSTHKSKIVKTLSKENLEPKRVQSAPETPAISKSPFSEKELSSDFSKQTCRDVETSPGSDDVDRDSVTGLRRVEPPADFSPETEYTRERTSSWSYKSSLERPRSPGKFQIEEDVLASVNVKPLVAIHERWIYEANRKTGRSMSLPEDNRNHIPAVKPASHCVDTLQKSLPQLNMKRPSAKPYRAHLSPAGSKTGPQWENFCQAREAVAKNINFGPRDPERFQTWRKDVDKETTMEEPRSESKMDQATDTRSIEEFIRDLIRKEFQHLLHEISDDTSNSAPRSEEILNKGVANIMENLNNGETEKRDSIKSFSRVKINGNNKPLLQITFTRSGENSLQVLDNCVNVTICDNNSSGRDKLNVSMEDTLTADDVQVHSLKRCQAFNAIQEARSTEDLYIDDDLSTQMQENFGGRVKLIPLHGSLHEILCEREDDCCLVKVKQENGCDTIYFRCDNSDTESRDAIDGCPHENRPQDTVVYKRSISLVEERIQRIFPKEKRTQTPVPRRKNQNVETVIKTRPKSEIFPPSINSNISSQTRLLSTSSPSLSIKAERSDEVELNIENVMCYQDSSSEECLRCQVENDDFELLEKKIEEDMIHGNVSNLTCGCLAKISEENLSVYDENVEK
ncbi:uncharacterized protein LOC126370518 isoform X2 [Pectinophora gossypiella]|uniref:uncharacterized protein LOC126370518 isoform X2 n=1 Tax=Pectinophora gossypiella TaxID=13191 RepID=UPI00214F34AA|nr:uncharacterized protein LOC126370518 isoform X2 [Pectinophora gossypiella]